MAEKSLKPVKTVLDAVREICLHLPETTEVISHGFPNFRVADKTFATFSVNHHGDGRVALLLAMGPGAQLYHVTIEPQYYFIPPYVGSRGWVGIELNKRLSWKTVALRVWEAYEWIAPGRLKEAMPPVIRITAPKPMTAANIDPMSPARIQKTLKRLASICLALPETSASTSFGNPVWVAGKKTFAQAWRYGGQLKLAFWVGPDRQDALIMDPRYSLPNYMAHNGWIALDAEHSVDWDEVESLVFDSYRHFALKRMLDLVSH